MPDQYPPRCTRAGCAHHVRRHRGRASSPRGLRMVGGQSWRWFCSRLCAARVAKLHEHHMRAIESKRAHHRAKLVAEIVRQVKVVVDDEGRVSVKEAARIAAWAYKKGYMHHAGQIYSRERHARVLALKKLQPKVTTAVKHTA